MAKTRRTTGTGSRAQFSNPKTSTKTAQPRMMSGTSKRVITGSSSPPAIKEGSHKFRPAGGKPAPGTTGRAGPKGVELAFAREKPARAGLEAKNIAETMLAEERIAIRPAGRPAGRPCGGRALRRARGPVNKSLKPVAYLPARPKRAKYLGGRVFLENGMLAPAPSYSALVYNGGPIIAAARRE